MRDKQPPLLFLSFHLSVCPSVSPHMSQINTRKDTVRTHRCPVGLILFLDASSHLYKRESVCPFVGPSPLPVLKFLAFLASSALASFPASIYTYSLDPFSGGFCPTARRVRVAPLDVGSSQMRRVSDERVPGEQFGLPGVASSASVFRQAARQTRLPVYRGGPEPRRETRSNLSALPAARRGFARQARTCRKMVSTRACVRVFCV